MFGGCRHDPTGEVLGKKPLVLLHVVLSCKVYSPYGFHLHALNCRWIVCGMEGPRDPPLGSLMVAGSGSLGGRARQDVVAHARTRIAREWGAPGWPRKCRVGAEVTPALNPCCSWVFFGGMRGGWQEVGTTNRRRHRGSHTHRFIQNSFKIHLKNIAIQ